MRDTVADAQGGGRIVRGKVSASGGLVSGVGFTVARTPGGYVTGDYTVTFVPPFRAPPVVTFGQYNTAPTLVPVFQSEPTARSMRIYMDDSTGTPGDAGFHFTAVEADPA